MIYSHRRASLRISKPSLVCMGPLRCFKVTYESASCLLCGGPTYHRLPCLNLEGHQIGLSRRSTVHGEICEFVVLVKPELSDRTSQLKCCFKDCHILGTSAEEIIHSVVEPAAHASFPIFRGERSIGIRQLQFLSEARYVHEWTDGVDQDVGLFS
jgi:hypothetical protein